MQCDVHQNDGDRSGNIPYLLDIQANLLSDLQTRIVVPLIRKTAFGRRATRLHPQFKVDGHDVVMATHLMAAIRRQDLGNVVASLGEHRDIVISAVDVVWSGV
jgi:toxin CcdB